MGIDFIKAKTGGVYDNLDYLRSDSLISHVTLGDFGFE